jgi:hypothetical protein
LFPLGTTKVGEGFRVDDVEKFVKFVFGEFGVFSSVKLCPNVLQVWAVSFVAVRTKVVVVFWFTV